MMAQESPGAKPSSSVREAYVSQARWAKPLPKQHANFIPAQNWLAYSWVDKDPELDFVKYAIEESGWTLEKIEQETERNGHRVSRYTLMAWYYGSTKRPQNATMNSVMAAIGWTRPWVRM
jgi:hypothetical protein